MVEVHVLTVHGCRGVPRGLLASSKRSPTNEPSRVGKEKEAIWGGSKVPGSTYSTPSMPLAL